jgi:hypothetical protein
MFFEGGLIRPFRAVRWFKRRRAVPLPYEIWEMILKLVLEELEHPYRQCTWLTFPDHHERIQSSGAVDTTTWKNCRLVCRTFAELMKPGFQFELSSNSCSIPEGVRVLHIRPPADSTFSLMKLTSSHSACQHITTLSLDLGKPGQDKYAIFVLMNGSKSLPELRSLTLLGKLPSQFYELLGQAFPLLVELYIGAYVWCRTAVTLPALEILHAKHIEADSPLLCPRLKHLFVQYSLKWGSGTFIEKHAANLESYHSRQELSYFHVPSIRAQFTNLRSFGEAMPYESDKLSSDSQLVPYPSHVYLYPPAPPSNRQAKSQRTIEAIATWTNVRFIFMDAKAIVPDEAAPLARMCKERGGQFTWMPPGPHPTRTPNLVSLVKYYPRDYISRGLTTVDKFLSKEWNARTIIHWVLSSLLYWRTA